MMATKRKVAKKTSTRKQTTSGPAPVQVAESTNDVGRLLKVLCDTSKPIEVRMAALQSLGAAAFSVANFDSVNADYIAALREVSTDSHEQLRRRALGILMRNKDGFAQEKLLTGLKDPTKALLPPEKALQLLGNDVHAEAYSVARAIVNAVRSDPAVRPVRPEAWVLLTCQDILAHKVLGALLQREQFVWNREIHDRLRY